MMTNFLVYDVFTDLAFGGNQLAVIPDATALPEDQLQKIAREFNFSETTFVYPPKDAANTARVRIFTPTMEVAFAGHPTIGTAIALRDLGHQGEMVLELGVGPIPCQFDGDLASFTAAQKLQRVATPDPALVAQCLSLSGDQIRTDQHPPIQASLGLPFVIVALVDAAALTAATPAIDALRKAAALHPAGLDFAIYAYVKNGDTIEARMFAPLDNIPEDPATGSAAATLGALLAERSGANQQLTIRQGVTMGRPSVIGVQAVAGPQASVTISGKAVRTMTGQLDVKP